PPDTGARAGDPGRMAGRRAGHGAAGAHRRAHRASAPAQAQVGSSRDCRCEAQGSGAQGQVCGGDDSQTQGLQTQGRAAEEGGPLGSVEREGVGIEWPRAPLMSQLIELRSRLLICVVAFILGFICCFYYSEPIYIFLVKPFAAAAAFHQAAGGGHHAAVSPLDLILGTAGLKPLPVIDGQTVNLIYTAPLEILFTKMKLAGFGAIIAAFPIIAWQLYRFVAPGLYRNERGAFLPFLIAAPVLFLLGAALVYYVMLPFVMWFSLSQGIDQAGVSAALLPKVSEYMNLVTALILAFGLCFQLPVIMTLLG